MRKRPGFWFSTFVFQLFRWHVTYVGDPCPDLNIYVFVWVSWWWMGEEIKVVVCTCFVLVLSVRFEFDPLVPYAVSFHTLILNLKLFFTPHFFNFFVSLQQVICAIYNYWVLACLCFGPFWTLHEPSIRHVNGKTKRLNTHKGRLNMGIWTPWRRLNFLISFDCCPDHY